MYEIISDLMVKYPFIITILMVIGMARLVLKPLMGIIHSVVDYTPSTSDNALVDKVEKSSTWKSICWFLDYLFSVKLIK